MIYDDIAKALAAEEHKQGLPLGGDPDHCDRCWDAEIDRRRRECEHPADRLVDITALCDVLRRFICNRCGDVLREAM